MPLQEIVFDEHARRSLDFFHPSLSHLIILYRDFLTGFHKRKLAKTQAARQKAIDREKQERLELRRQVCLIPCLSTQYFIISLQNRRMLRQRAKENAAQVEKAYGAVLGELHIFSS